MTVLERLYPRPGRDLQDLLAAFDAGRVARIPADLRQPCAHARLRPAAFNDHGPVLALSIGGSNSAALLGENRGGRLHVLDAVRLPNPARPEPWTRFLDHLLLSRPFMAGYLRDHPAPRVGVTIAVPFRDGVPFHPSKIATLDGLVARNLDGARATHHFPENFARWLAAHGLRPATVACEGDAPAAHLGGLAAHDLAPDIPAILLVCGTGMACADDRHFILPGMLRLLVDRDPQLYPATETEDGQYQYLCAGKGIYRVLRQAIRLGATEPGSALASAPAPDWLRDAADSKWVYKLWHGTLPDASVEALPPVLAEVRATHGAAAWAELTALAAAIAHQAVHALSASLLASLADRGDAAGREVAVFLEGSIARNADVFAALRRVADDDLALLRRLRPDRAPAALRWCLESSRPPTGDQAHLACLDLALHGAAAMAMTAA